MPRRFVPTVLLALACLAVLGAAAPAGALTRDAQTQQNVKLLKTYIDAYAGGHGFVYPAAAVIRKGGGLTAPVWPVNPWTGAAMAPGKARGTYTYTGSAKGDGYTLTGHLSSGSYTVTGGTPGWLADERARAAADLQGARDAAAAAQADLAAARQERDAASADAATARQQRDTAVADAASARRERDAAVADAATAREARDSALAQLATAQGQLTSAQTDLATAQGAFTTAQASLVTARDQAAELGARVIKGYVEQWGMLYNATAPAANQVAKTGSVGSLFAYWPANPFTGQPMAVSGQPGDYTYMLNLDGISYAMTSHTASTDVSLDGTIPPQLKNALDNARSAATNVSIEAIQAAIDRYALDNNDTYPALVSRDVLGTYIDSWPKNPWTNADMVQGTGQGDYTYVGNYDSYTLTAHVKGGATGDTVDDFYAERVSGMRERYKDVYCQAAAQVLKEYVEEWKAAHAGAPPTVTQMDAAGAVGTAHGWWPANPWLGSGMTNTDSRGDFQYAAGVGGAYTLTVRQAPITPYSEYYTPQ